MDVIKIEVEVQCTRPTWALENQHSIRHPFYRIYLAENLLTERSWLYGNDHIIDEELYANLKLNEPYVIRIEPVLKIPGQARFIISNFRTPEKNHEIITSDDLSVTFKIH